ncbi:hypothetical protein SteCoe_15996 [Stentor coeruleus]|uniref:CBM20 domain-containing protein n=1 Tax=Stentor coeruleus TaxID=5963 RepID=A0A1R2C281_9CILI|nr:hypothetical protein SteCoe_15996 [Stentor coeruleus]
MNGNHINEEESKIFSFLNFSHRQSLENISKSSEAERIRKSQKHSTFDMSELRNNPDILKRLLDTAIQIEKEKDISLTYEFNFSIAYNTSFGERVVITGKPDFLGNWDPLRGLELEWNPGNLWKVDILISEGVIKDFEYKYACVKSSSIVWEGGENRMFNISDGVKTNSHMVFRKEDYWQNY